MALHGSRANLSTRRRSGPTIRYTATIPERWPNCARPVGEHPELMAGITGDFDGNPPAVG
jgi:hypothetical protein